MSLAYLILRAHTADTEVLVVAFVIVGKHLRLAPLFSPCLKEIFGMVAALLSPLTSLFYTYFAAFYAYICIASVIFVECQLF